MTIQYKYYFVKDNKYRGSWCDIRTYIDEIVEVMNDYSYIFKGDFYDTWHGDHQAIEIDLDCFDKLKKSFVFINYDHIGFLQNLLLVMESALEHNFKLFLGSEYEV